MPSSSGQAASAARARLGPGRPKGKSRGEALRAQLIVAALELFAQRGISETPLSAVAARAGVTKAMVHYHFTSREQLLDVLIHEHMLPLRTQALSALGSSEDPAVALAAFASCLVGQAMDHPWLAPLWVREVTSEGGVLRERMRAHIDPKTERTALDRIERWQASGTLNPAIVPELLALSILGMAMVPLAATATATARGDLQQHRAMLLRHVEALLLGGALSGR